MMPMNQKKELNISIAKMAPFSVSVAGDDEEEIWLEAAELANSLWSSWTARFTKKSSAEVLGMVTLRFAQAFVVNSKTEKEMQSLLNGFEKDIDALLSRDILK